MRRNKANADIRQAATEHGLYLWQVARRAGISQSTITAWLREPLPPEKRAALMAAIEGEGGEDGDL